MSQRRWYRPLRLRAGGADRTRAAQVSSSFGSVSHASGNLRRSRRHGAGEFSRAHDRATAWRARCARRSNWPVASLISRSAIATIDAATGMGRRPRLMKLEDAVGRIGALGKDAAVPGAKALSRHCAKTPLARGFVSHSCERLTKIAVAPRDSSAHKRIGPRVTIGPPSTIMPAIPRSPS